ncbi:hypothetical protein [Companilactobacillus nodensis]|uniref:Uncharacterized protein n=1 Tax=Companilactobacillus nodensis DSM 19682 = JCM 14932 = NBRC 107160 TaxID=1423775 RepID=A0A0R1K6D7_9LACO|nr:hypothetical protein FD03_GL002192 [Companilactobacillus nodensis DSM 19682 = JCM 14932 = NBRC 107160]
MIKTYRKVATIQAEQFDGSDEMFKKYNITPPMPLDPDYTINTLEGDMVLGVNDWIATGVDGEHWAIRDDIFKKSYMEVGNDKKIVKAVQFDSWDEEMMSTIGVYTYDYGIHLININGLQVFLSQGDWIVTYQDGSQFVIPDEDWKAKK